MLSLPVLLTRQGTAMVADMSANWQALGAAWRDAWCACTPGAAPGSASAWRLMVRARLGLGPWDVLHQGIARRLGVQLGWVTIGVSAWSCWPGSRCGSGRAWARSATRRCRPGRQRRRWTCCPRPGAGLARRLAGRRRSAERPRHRLLHRRRARPRPARRADDRHRRARALAAPGAHADRARRCWPPGWLLGGRVGIGTVAYALSHRPAHPRAAAPADRRHPASQTRAAKEPQPDDD